MADEKLQKKANAKKRNVRAKNKKQGKDRDNMTASAIVQNDRRLRVRLPIKIGVIILSVLALSWFFEGLRQVQKGPSLAHIAVFIGGITATSILLWVQGFWIYLEEKYKGTLRKKIAHFDKLEEYWLNKRDSHE